jgi:hypothetical protein
VGITREYHKALRAYGDSGKYAGGKCAAETGETSGIKSDTCTLAQVRTNFLL